MSSSSPSRSLPEVAAQLFAEHLELPEGEQDARFDALCVQHPDLAEHLHRLREERRRQAPPAPEAGLQRLPTPPPVAAHEPEAEPVLIPTPALQPGSQPPEKPEGKLPAERPSTVVLQAAERSALDGQREPTVAATAADQDARYTVLGELGRGGMGVALRVFDTVLRRQLAMKVLTSDPDIGDADRQALVARFVDEARVTGCLEHPGIVPVYDLHHDPSGRIYFTMPIIEGVDLHEVFRRVREHDAEWTLQRAVGVILRVCEAVAYAHDRGVLHRDLTPANVRIGKFGEVHVIDWGLAKVLGRSQGAEAAAASTVPAEPARKRRWWRGMSTPFATMHGTVLGTPAYMPPEQAEGRIDDVGPRSDVYAVGALLYHLLTGAAPYSGRRREQSPERVLRLVRRGKPPAIERLNRQAPPELVAISEKAMSRQPADRYADMSAMASDLQAYSEGRVVPTYEHGSWAVLRKLIRRNRLASLVVAGAVFAMAFNLVEFAISHVRYRALLTNHNAELDAARDEAALAAALARRGAEVASRLRDEAWQVVRQPDAAASGYELALAKARAATSFVAEPRNLMVEGAALVRCRCPEPAVQMLQRVDGTDQAVALPALAFRGLAAAMLGDRDAAARCRDQLLEGLRTVPAEAPHGGELAALLAELTTATATPQAADSGR